MARYGVQEYWETSLPDLYDVWYGWHERDEPAKTIASLLREFIVPKEGPEHKLRILDCACGTGNPSLALLKMGFDVTSSDGSAAMLKLAETHSRELGLAEGFKYTRVVWSELANVFSQERFDAVICTGNAICHVPPEGVLDAVENMAKVLRPGGVCIIDVKRYSQRVREMHFDRVQGWVQRYVRCDGCRQLCDGRIAEFVTTLLYHGDDAPGRVYEIQLGLQFCAGSHERYVFPVWAITSDIVMHAFHQSELHPCVLRPTSRPIEWKYDFCIGQNTLQYGARPRETR